MVALESCGMATVLLLRHGRTTANTAGVLAGRTAGVRLDPTGMEQAQRAAQRVSAVPVAAIVIGGLLFGIGMVLARGCASRPRPSPP